MLKKIFISYTFIITLQLRGESSREFDFRGGYSLCLALYNSLW